MRKRKLTKVVVAALSFSLCLGIFASCEQKDNGDDSVMQKTDELKNETSETTLEADIIQDDEMVETENTNVTEEVTEENTENTISDENDESDIATDNGRISLPCDGRDGTADAPYKIGDSIVFPNYAIGFSDENGPVCSNVTLVVQEATSDYIKVSVDYGIDSWAGIGTSDRMPETHFFLRGFSEIGEPLTKYTDVVYRDEAGNRIEEFDENETFIEAYLRYENTKIEVDANIGDAKYLVFVETGTTEGEDPLTYIILE